MLFRCRDLPREFSQPLATMKSSTVGLSVLGFASWALAFAYLMHDVPQLRADALALDPLGFIVHFRTAAFTSSGEWILTSNAAIFLASSGRACSVSRLTALEQVFVYLMMLEAGRCGARGLLTMFALWAVRRKRPLVPHKTHTLTLDLSERHGLPVVNLFIDLAPKQGSFAVVWYWIHPPRGLAATLHSPGATFIPSSVIRDSRG